MTRARIASVLLSLSLGLCPQLAVAKAGSDKAGKDRPAPPSKDRGKNKPKVKYKRSTCQLYVKGFPDGDHEEASSARLTIELKPNNLTTKKFNRSYFCKLKTKDGVKSVIGVKREGPRMILIVGGGAEHKMPAGHYWVSTLDQKTMKPNARYAFEIGSRSLLTSFEQVSHKTRGG